MSLAARRIRSSRQDWAAPGGSHDRLVALARIALPIAIGVLAAFLVLAPLNAGGDVSFLLNKKKVAVAQERMKLQRADYRGQDDKGQLFELTAGSAIQHSSAEPLVRLSALTARIDLPDGPATIRANAGLYDMDTKKMRLDGPLHVQSGGGYDLKTTDAMVDLGQHTIDSGSAVTGLVPQGRFSANAMHADLANRTVTLSGNARLRIVPRGPK